MKCEEPRIANAAGKCGSAKALGPISQTIPVASQNAPSETMCTAWRWRMTLIAAIADVYRSNCLRCGEELIGKTPRTVSRAAAILLAGPSISTDNNSLWDITRRGTQFRTRMDAKPFSPFAARLIRSELAVSIKEFQCGSTALIKDP